ncbi:unnamed protein product [Dovyalis caffra]|uniref:Uncharacterized protein n=1 Tax=Dovyalis caffra TaxID=77055 RepID=A0AAV1SG48_9ROSI|nr:unnamed protein product [Dovyalis caffra]
MKGPGFQLVEERKLLLNFRGFTVCGMNPPMSKLKGTKPCYIRVCGMNPKKTPFQD